MIVRPIDRAELEFFAAFSDDHDENAQLFERLVAGWESGHAGPESTFVAEEQGTICGRLALRRPDGGHAYVEFLDVDWGDTWREAGAALLTKAAASAAPRRLMYALDRPHPWHSEPERRRELFEQAGYRVAREAKRWEWTGEPLPARPERLRFSGLEEVGDDAFVDAIARVSDGTLDRRLQGLRDELGRAEDAVHHLRLLRRLDHEPGWFQLGYDARGGLVGLVIVARAGTPVIGYVGVVPEQRGKGYVDELLAQGTRTLADAGETVVRADTDVANAPMAKAFERAGYVNFMARTELELIPAGSQEPNAG